MNLFGVMELSGTALTAERIRAEVVAANMANAETTRTQDGGPYRRQNVVFAANPMDQPSFGGVLSSQLDPTRGSEGVEVAAVVQESGAPLRRYSPGHPDADADGYVNFPDINPMTEMVDLMGANRSYQLNATAVQAEKTMLQASIDLLK